MLRIACFYGKNRTNVEPRPRRLAEQFHGTPLPMNHGFKTAGVAPSLRSGRFSGAGALFMSSFEGRIPEVNDATVQVDGSASGSVWTVSKALGNLTGVMNLVTNETYFWRVRAQDSRSTYSDWSTGTWWFVYGTPAPSVRGFSTLNNGVMSFEWERTDKAVYIMFTTNLMSGTWQPASGPLYGTNLFLSTSNGVSTGFYRIRTE